MEGRYVWRSGVAEFAVNLVGIEEQVVALYEVAQLLHLAACIKIACGVVRVADKNPFGAFSYEFFKLLDRR